MLPFLPSLRETEKGLRQKADWLNSPLGLFVETIKGLPEATTVVGKEILRDTPRSIASLELKMLNIKEPLVAETPAQKFLFGEEPIKAPETPLEFGLAVLGATPFGIGKKQTGKIIGEELFEQITKRYGKKLAEQIIQKGGKELAEKSVIEGGEMIVADALKTTSAKITIGKLIGAVSAAKPVRKITEQLFTHERAKRVAIGAKQLERTGGEKGFFAAKGALKGELPKAQFEPPKDRFTQREIDDLFDFVKTKSDIDFFDKINTMTGLEKVLGKGQIPTESELKLLKQVFGDDFVKEVLKKRPFREKLLEGAAEIMNVPRSLMASMDMSAPFRQGLILSIHKPKRAVQAFGQMFKYFGSTKHFNAAMEEISKRPTAKIMKESGLYIADVTGKAITLSSKEESFMSNLARRIPVIGNLVSASERAYAGYLNKLRADVFDDITKEYIRGGILPEESPRVWKSLAEFINTATGRGNIGVFNKAAPILNSVFFSPRFMMSRIQMLNPQWYLSLEPAVRKEAAKSMIKFVGSGITLATLAKLGGFQVETDPRSSDFGKIRMGNIRWDIWGGFQQWIRFTSQLITGEIKSVSTGRIRTLDKKQFPHESRFDLIVRFFSGKLAPVPAFASDLLRGQTLVGDPLDWKQESFEKVVPLYIQDIMDAVREEGAAGILAIAPAFFGLGVQAFPAFKHKKNKGILPKLPSLPSLPELPALPSL